MRKFRKYLESGKEDLMSFSDWLAYERARRRKRNPLRRLIRFLFPF